MIDLKAYPAIQSNLFVRIVVPEYRESAAAGYTSEILRFSDKLTPFSINDEEYVGIGNLMNITATTSEIRATSSQLQITVSGIPNASLYAALNSKIKGAEVRIYRALFNANDPNELIPVTPNPMLRYRGFVNNYSLQETFNFEVRESTNTIVFICASALDVLSNKYTGRKTNPTSMKRFYPTDVSMDRVPNLENATFDFGAPK